MTDFAAALEARLIRYVQVDTQSDENSTSVPSTAGQWDLLRLLQQELIDLGAADIRMTEQGFLLATLSATAATGNLARIAFLAHVDTSPAFHATGVKPLVHRAYNGEPIVLPDDPSQVLSPAVHPYLGQKIGDDIITASGTTLLGADDKAGIAIIMTMAEHLLTHPEIAHGPIRICFTPDEEIGSGINHIELEDLGADVAYTLDGAELGELIDETFSADKAVVHVHGVSTHPGDAFGKMVNAWHLAATIIDTLPQHTRTPETTTNREGFIHAYQMVGSAAQAEISFILRDFEREGLASHGALLQQVCAAVAATEPRAQISCTITPQYRNMRYWLADDRRPIDTAIRAMRAVAIEPRFEPIRGGTDGSRLTERGLPTPNIFTGMQNIHGPLEWVSIQDMAHSVEVCVQLAQEWAQIV